MDLVTLALAKNYTDKVVEENGGAGSVAQVQADWDQSDETAVDFIKNKPFGVNALPYFSGNNKISITNWETVEDPDIGTRHYSSEHITEENFYSFPAVGDKFIIKTNGSDSYKEQELICCYSKPEGNGGFFILGDSELAIEAGYVDGCDITTYSNYAIKCTRATEPVNEFEDWENAAGYGKIQMVLASDGEHPTEIELFGPTKLTTIPDKFIPAQVPNVKIYATPGQILSVKSVDEEWFYPAEWELIDLPSSGAATDITDIVNEIFNFLPETEDYNLPFYRLGSGLLYYMMSKSLLPGRYSANEESIQIDYAPKILIMKVMGIEVKVFIDEENEQYYGLTTINMSGDIITKYYTGVYINEGEDQQIDYKPTGYAEPTEDTGVANKKYVDDAIAAALANLGIAEEGAY